MCLVTGCPENSQFPPAKDLKFCFKHDISIDDDELLNGLKKDSTQPIGKRSPVSGPDDDGEEEFLKEEVEEDETLGGVADGVAEVKIESSEQEDDLTSPPSSPALRSKKKKHEKKTRRTNKQSSEKRKEKSRDAARCRRSKETKLYNALSDCLPLPHDVLANLDKASIMRLAIACLNTTNMVTKGLRVRDARVGPLAEEARQDSALREVCGSASSPYQEALLQAVDGFVLVLSSSGDVAFVSTSIANYLGLAQVDVMGASLYDLVHQCDHEDLSQLLATSANTPLSSQRSGAVRRSSSTCGGSSSRGIDGARKASSRRSRSTVAAVGPVKLPTVTVSADTSRQSEEEEAEDDAEGDEYCEPRHGFIRMKCTLANRGRNVTIRNASYKVVEISGKLVRSRAPRSGGLTAMGWLICIASPVPHPANIEVPLDRTTYFSKHSLDMKFTYADENFPQFCGFLPRQLVGQSLFQLHHELDGALMRKSFLTLRAKGQVSTGQYRFLAAGGGYVWLVTQATVIHAHRDSSPSAIVCLHYVISGVECPGQILSCIQLVGDSPRPPLLPSALCSPRTGGDVGFCGSSSSVGGTADAVQQKQPATHQDMLLIPSNTKDKTNTAKTLQQQKTTGTRGGGVLVGVAHGVTRAVPSAPALLSPSCVPANRQHQHTRKAAGEHITICREGDVAPTDNLDLKTEPSSYSTTTANNNINVKIDPSATVPTIRIDSSFVILDDTQQQQPDNDDTKSPSASASPFSSCSNSHSPSPVHLGGRSSSPSLGWTSCGRSSAAPLLSQAAAGLFCPPQQPAPPSPQEQLVSSTASLFETSLPSSEQRGLDGDGLSWERYLFPEEEVATGSSTSDLFADINPSQLNLTANSNLSQDMDIIDGTTLFKNEPFCDGEDFDARAPFLPLCEDENLIMWSPSLELECDAGGEDSTPDFGSNSSGSSPGSCGSNSHSPDRQSSGDSGDSVYGPDGYLTSSAASTPGEHTLLNREDDGPPSLLAELLQQTAPDCRPSDSQPPATCIDPNKVWPGHNRTPLPAPPPEDEEMFELERFLQEDDLQDYAASGRSPTLASASLNTVHITLTPSPASTSLSYSTPFSPAYSSLTPFSCNTSSPAPNISSPASSPLPPDFSPTIKRPSSPLLSPQMPRKRLCSPHVEESQLQQQKSSSLQREPVKSGRKLQMPNAPYMQQLLVSKHIPGKCSNSSKCVRSCASCCKSHSSSDGKEASSSVLRNLLVSGHDASEGHYVLPPSPCHSPDTSGSSSPVATTTASSVQRSPAPDRSARQGSCGSRAEKYTPHSPASPARRGSGGSRAEARGSTSPAMRSSRNPQPPARSSNTSPANTREPHSSEMKGYRKIIPCTVVRDVASSSPSSNVFCKPVFSVASTRNALVGNASESDSFVSCKLESSVPVSSYSVDGSNFNKPSPPQSRQTEQPTILLGGETDSAVSGSLPLLLRRTPSGELKLVRLTTCKSAVFANQSGGPATTATRRPKADNAAPSNTLRYPNILPKSPGESERCLNSETYKGRLLLNSSGGSNRRLVALPKGMTLVPRLQMIQTRPPPQTLYRVVTAEQTATRTPETQLLPISNRSRTLLLRGNAQEKEGGGPFVATRNLKPVRLVNDRNIMEYVCQEDDLASDQQKGIGSPDCFYASDDSFEWVEVLDDGSGSIDSGVSRPSLLKEVSGNPRSFCGQMVGNVRNDRCTETAKCLLLPQHEYSPVTMFRLTQSDYDVNAPAPTDLLRGQELLEALDKTLQ